LRFRATDIPPLAPTDSPRTERASLNSHDLCRTAGEAWHLPCSLSVAPQLPARAARSDLPQDRPVHDTPPVAPEFRPPATPFLGDVPPRVIQSTEIFQGDHEVLVQHGDQTYRLRITRANRLILNK